MRKFLLGLIFVFICGLAASNVAASTIINGGFEDDDGITATAWDNFKDITDPAPGWHSPLDGNAMSSITAVPEAITVTAPSGFGSGNVAELGTKERIYQMIDWQAGDVLTFDWQLDLTGYSAWYPNTIPNAWGLLVGLPDSAWALAGDVYTEGGDHDYAGFYSGTYQYTFSDGGGLSGALTILNQTVGTAYIDNVRWMDEVTGPTPTPEPSTIILFSLGLLGFAGIGRKRKR